MKKLLAAVALFFAFSIGASAQEAKGTKMSAEEAAKWDALKMTEVLNISASQQNDFARLFTMKHQVMMDESMSAERKAEMTKIVDAKIRASLTPEQLKKLDSDPKLLAILTGPAETSKK
jgi:phosphate/sulfate permease